MCILILFYYWLLDSASKGLHQADIYKKKNYMHQHFKFCVNIGLMMDF